jgi:hypothetical protein
MNEKDAAATLKAFEGELEKEEARWRAAERRVSNLRQIVSGLKGYLREASGRAATESPTNSLDAALAIFDNIGQVAPTVNREAKLVKQPKDAIPELLQEQAKRWSVPELMAEMQRRGWLDSSLKDPKAAIRIAAVRLAQDGKIAWDSNGGFLPLGLVPTAQRGRKGDVA